MMVLQHMFCVLPLYECATIHATIAESEGEAWHIRSKAIPPFLWYLLVTVAALLLIELLLKALFRVDRLQGNNIRSSSSYICIKIMEDAETNYTHFP